MKPKDLLSKISHVESLLNEFSYEELHSDQAATLRQAFENFTLPLENILAEDSIAADNASQQAIKENRKADGRNQDGLLIANVSHELRTPLNEIIDFTALLKEEELNEVQLERVNALQTASHSLIEFSNELLEYSKLAAGLEQFKSINFNFYWLLRDVVYLCKTLIVRENVSLELVIDPAIPEVLIGDPAKLSQVLLNLLGKAIKFVDEGQIHLNILLRNKTEDSLYIEFTIADNGIGIAAEQLPFIFDLFRQAGSDNASAYGRTGLGLGIVKQIVTQLDGKIAVASNLGKGTTFKCCLPYAAGDKTKLRKNDTAKEYLQDAAKLIKGTRILVFEDNPINQRFIAQRLKKWGCPVFVTENGEYGLSLLDKQDIDLILMDLRMPGMSGLEITERIRKHKSPAIRQLPIIALTADFSIQDKEKSEMHGINDYLLKPYSPDELLLKLFANKNKMESKSKLSAPAPAVGPAENAKSEIFSLDPIFEDCMEQMELLEELVRLYKQNAIEFIGETKFQLQRKDFEAMEFSLHKMKSGLAMMRTNELLALVEQMQSCCKSDRDLKHLNFLYASFVTQYHITQEKIESEVVRLQKKYKTK